MRNLAENKIPWYDPCLKSQSNSEKRTTYAIVKPIMKTLALFQTESSGSFAKKIVNITKISVPNMMNGLSVKKTKKVRAKTHRIFVLGSNL